MTGWKLPKKHENCRPITPSSRFLPRRLLEINHCQDSLLVRVCETNSFKESVQYMALSHCWGSGDVCRLLSSNIDAYSREIPFDNLSRLFQEAIKFTARAQVNYIWIDALCIIQDSRKDWKNRSIGDGADLSECSLQYRGYRFCGWY